MSRLFAVSLAALLCSTVCSTGLLMAQDAAKPTGKPAANAAAPAAKVGAGKKVCNYKFPDGEKRSWVCDKEQPCCAWDLIKYVKCGSTITNCL